MPEAVAVSQSRPAEESARSLPAPVAIPFFSALQESSPGERFRTAMETIEAMVRFMFACAIGRSLPPSRQDRVGAIRDMLGDRPTLGSWVGAFRESVGDLRMLTEPIAGALMSMTGKRTQLGRFLFEEFR